MRAKTSVARHHRIKRIMKAARGYDQGRHRLYRTAKEAVYKSYVDSLFGRKVKKRDFRALWITRINIALRAAGMTYSQFINRMKKAKIELNRKALSELAISDAKTFIKVIEAVKT